MAQIDQWRRYQRYLCDSASIGLQLDVSRMMFDDTFLESMGEPIAAALQAMRELERGCKVNVDEDRMVGHYWLRSPDLAPDAETRTGIEQAIAAVKKFADQVHEGAVKPQRGDGFYIVLVIGVGGSVLGPQLVTDALGTAADPMILRFVDNTDPDGIDRTLAELDETLEQTLTVVISKSGGTKETRNGMLEVAAAYQRKGLSFPAHAVAVTCEGSGLDRQAVAEKWLRVLPIWDWVGGRTSVTSAVGLLPAALAGVDVDAFLSGARDCDVTTRENETMKNPAALLAMMWHYAATVRDRHNMVVLPYRDRLGLMGRYLQQLVMESIGKASDRDGNAVLEGLSVYGNKGSTDQHAFVQQLRDGRNDFFAMFIRVLHDRDGPSLPVEEGVTSGDYLDAFFQGTRAALFERGRESMTLTLNKLDARGLGAVIALFERAVGLYAELINVNAYDQPGVEAGKQAAAGVLALQGEVLAFLRAEKGSSHTAEQIADAVGHADDVETVHHLLEHAAANPDHGVNRAPGATPSEALYGVP